MQKLIILFHFKPLAQFIFGSHLAKMASLSYYQCIRYSMIFEFSIFFKNLIWFTSLVMILLKILFWNSRRIKRYLPIFQDFFFPCTIKKPVFIIFISQSENLAVFINITFSSRLPFGKKKVKKITQFLRCTNSNAYLKNKLKSPN